MVSTKIGPYNPSVIFFVHFLGHVKGNMYDDDSETADDLWYSIQNDVLCCGDTIFFLIKWYILLQLHLKFTTW